MAAEGKRKVVIVLDEFQQILEYTSDMVERRLRSVIQHQNDVAYLFLGSRKHLIQRLFLNKNRPLYRSAGHYPLETIKEEHWRPFIQERFEQWNKHINDEAIDEVLQLTQGHPFYTQHLCHVLWERCVTGRNVDSPLIAASLEILLRREGFAYTTLWESLTVNQRRFLRGIAMEPVGVETFSAEHMQKYGLKSPSSAQRAVAALLEKDLIDRDRSAFFVQDRFFSLWIRGLGPAEGTGTL